jgi:hypothetical protein
MSEFINVSAVKKLVKANDRQCSPGFLVALDAHVSAKIRGACEVHNGGAKRLDGAVLEVAPAAPAESSKKESKDDVDIFSRIREIRTEVIVMELQTNVITEKEFRAAMQKIKSICDQIVN